MYPPPLILECEDSAGPWNFLETEITIAGGRVFVRHAIHNALFAWGAGELKRLPTHPEADVNQRRLETTALIHRIRTNCNTGLGVIISVLEKALELTVAGGGVSEVMVAMGRMKEKYPEEQVWDVGMDMLRMIWLG